MKRFPYILCIVFPVFVWACHTSRQTIGEARENRVHSIDRDLHVVIDSLCRNEWSGLTEWEWIHVDVFDSMQDKTVNPSISITRLKQSKKVVARNETAVSDSLNETAALQSRSEKEQNHRSSKEMDTHRVSGCVLMIFIVILFFYIITKNEMRHILAELTIFIEGVPDNFAMIGKVLNVATGLLPLQKNEDGTFGTASYTKEECDIPLRIAVPGETLKTETLRLMPTANGFHTTKLFIQLISPGGVVSNYDIEAPVMKSGGKYKINLEFEEMKPYMYLTSTKIDDWTEEWIYRGEILNPED